MLQSVKLKINDNELIIETGKLAKQAHGSVLIKYAGSVVLVTATMAKELKEGQDFFPLTVSYQERIYAAGKIPGGFFKREGRPTDKEILVSRLIDRPLRPLFPEGFRNEVQIVPVTLSADKTNPPDILAIIGASAALSISNIPFNGPIGAVRIGKVDNTLVILPNYEEIEKSTIDIVVAGTKNGILMVEGSSAQVSEDEMIEVLQLAHKHIIDIVKVQEELVKKMGGIQKIVPELFVINDKLKDDVTHKTSKLLKEYLSKIADKKERNEKMEELYNTTVVELKVKYPDMDEENLKNQIKEIMGEIERDTVRNMILNDKRRLDGRDLTSIRPITCEIDFLPRTHGSALFTRGQTQSLGVATLGTVDDKQRFDDIEGEDSKSFMLHYNFPPFSVGETGRMGGPSRREVGHGMLAERALARVLPDSMEFPYTIRLVSEILESNGSSSMASVCSGCLALLDAGVPIKDSVAGIAMGLVLKDEKHFAVLSDILGEEDHLGDMDFKVAGTKNGITAFQMDIKIDSITFEIMEKALHQAKEGRLFILQKMNEVIDKPKKELSEYAPKIKTLKIDKDKIAMVIGGGGKVIKEIIQRTNTNISIDDDGNVMVSGEDIENVNNALDIISDIVVEVKVGEVYEGTVARIVNFGAFVELPGNKDGLVHISKMSKQRVNRVEDVLSIGQKVKVKVAEIDNLGRVNLTMLDVE